MRSLAMRRVHGTRERRERAVVRVSSVFGGGQEGGDARRPRDPRASPPAPARVHRGAGRAMRVLHQRHDHGGSGVPLAQQEADGRRDQDRARGQSLPLRDPPAHRPRRQASSRDADVRRAMISSLTRRQLLKSGGALFVGFTLVPRIANAAAPANKQAASGAAKEKTVAPDQVDGLLAIDAKGKVTVFSGKVDLGTGIRTAMAQIAAEELSVPLADVTVVQGDTALTPDQGVTFGSLSIQNGGMQIRQAAATARQALIAQAATKLSADKESLTVEQGRVVPKGGGKGVTYGQLIGGKQFDLKLDPKAPTKDPKDFTIVGKPIRRLDIPGKVTGTFEYMHDFRIAGMQHARVVHPSGIKAELQSVDDAGCRKIPGYQGLVRKANFLAVVARDEWSAIKAARAIKTTWSDWAG